jgi:hypothetical protein
VLLQYLSTFEAVNASCPVAAGCFLQVIKGFDLAVTGLAVGESRKERIAPENAVSHAQGLHANCWAPLQQCRTAFVKRSSSSSGSKQNSSKQSSSSSSSKQQQQL